MRPQKSRPKKPRRADSSPPSPPCQWPIGDPGAPKFRFCGAASAGDPRAPYCAAHLKRAYDPAPPPALVMPRRLRQLW
jgi:hypothetical protein